jgi:hypothetical protein
VNCSASDGSRTTSGTFTVTVELVDHTAPTFSGVSANRQVEANGPTGSIVNYSTPTATDSLDGPIALVNCSPASGTTFPIGTTVVTCSATDAHGNLGSVSFSLTVADTTPPTLLVPEARSIYASTPTGIQDTITEIASFLNGASATDIVDPAPVVTENAPPFIPVGTHGIIFTARDASGNATSREVTLIVLPQPPAGTPPLPVPPAPRPPANVRNLAAKSLDRAVRLTWVVPAGAREVVVTRSENEGTSTASRRQEGQIVYRGSGSSFVDRGLTNGVEYRYVVVTVDAAGNQSAGIAVVVVPRRDRLKTPKDGARLRKAPKLVWAADPEASYYNAQLLLGGQKILSVWPLKPSFTLKKTWKFQGRKYTLKRGVYHWYVWPGYGARAAVDYGDLLGTRTFRIVR